MKCLYANAGMGCHGTDARGGVIAVDPRTGEPVDRVTPLVPAKGAELGVRSHAELPTRIRPERTFQARWPA